MNKKQQQINELEQQIVFLNQELNDLKEPECEKWNPKGGEWFINGYGGVMNQSSNRLCAKTGIEFQTEQSANDASKAYRFYHRLYKLAEELNDGWVADFKNYQKKYFISFSNTHNIYNIDVNTNINKLGCIYFKDKKQHKKQLKF